MKIAIGEDHAGFEVKQQVIEYLKGLQIDVVDKGAYSLDSVDYPEFGHAVGKAVSTNEVDRGIVICGSGIGISIATNKIKGIRAALCTSIEHAEMCRKHNDANVLAVGAQMTELNMIYKMISVWLETEFEGGRHQLRVNKIDL